MPWQIFPRNMELDLQSDLEFETQEILLGLASSNMDKRISVWSESQADV